MHTSEIVKRWGAAPGKLDIDRDLLADFQSAGFRYAPDKAALDTIDPARTDRLLGLFSHSNMNVALDKIDGRRGKLRGVNGRVVDDYGFPDQPMLDEMTTKALAVLERQKKGFVLMVEGASIDKQAHNMDTERWMLDTIEFDRAVKVAQSYAADNRLLVGYGANPDRFEDWRTNERPVQDSQQPFVKTAPLTAYPGRPGDARHDGQLSNHRPGAG